MVVHLANLPVVGHNFACLASILELSRISCFSLLVHHLLFPFLTLRKPEIILNCFKNFAIFVKKKSLLIIFTELNPSANAGKNARELSRNANKLSVSYCNYIKIFTANELN